MDLTLKQKIAFGIGAVGKDMVYALSASYMMYFYQDVLGLSATFVGLILMIARIFDAVNDPFMGVLVAKTKSRWGRFRPWLFSGTVFNAVVLYAMFGAPHLEQTGLMVYFAVVYILWGVTYTMMDIPYWSMIPAVTKTPADRENLSVVGRTCAGVGSVLIAMFTMLLVGVLGGDSERLGFRWVALIVAVVFIVSEMLCCAFLGTRPNRDGDCRSEGNVHRPVLQRPDRGGGQHRAHQLGAVPHVEFHHLFLQIRLRRGGWKGGYTLLSTVGGATQILGMMVIYPLLRKKLSNTRVFAVSVISAFCAYVLLLVLCLSGLSGILPLLLIPGVVVLPAMGCSPSSPLCFVQQCGLRPVENRAAGGVGNNIPIHEA